MPTREEYAETLRLLVASLRRKPLTARAIAALLGCSRPVAYERLRAVQELGARVYTVAIRESATGPKSKAYGVR